MTSAQRLRISFCALPDEDVEELRAVDLDFYGSNSSGWSDSSADDDELRLPSKLVNQVLLVAALALPRKLRARMTTQKPAVQVATAMPAVATSQLKSVTSKKSDVAVQRRIATLQSLEELMYSLEKGTKRDKNSFIMGELSAGLQKPAAGASRRNFVYGVLGHEVCHQASSQIYSLSHHSLQSLQEFVEAGRIAPLPHKLSGRPASHATSAGLKADISFIRNYEASFGLPQPAASRGARSTPPTYLPASLTILQLFQTFQTTKPDANISHFTFRKVWLESAADIKL